MPSPQSGTLATKEDILATKQDIAALELKLSKKISDMIKWMFIFWIGQVAVTLGFILLFLKNNNLKRYVHASW